jgi:hypothetical protein
MQQVRINLYKKRGRWDVLGWCLGVQQRSAITHANIEIDGTCYTTGAHFDLFKGWVFGAVPAAKYNAKRDYYQCEFVNPLSTEDVINLWAYCKSLNGQPYGLEKVIALTVAGNTKAQFICHLGKLDQGVVKNPFCSEAVVAACWSINRLICQWLCREEPSVCTPHDIYLEAKRGEILHIVNTVGFVPEA